MAKPDPQGGLVIRYDYLWVSEEGRGREEGAKVRPCAVVVAIPATDKAPQRALVCGITHSKPQPPDDGVEIPPMVRRYLGLDDDTSWAITSEVNLVDWDDPGIIPINPDRWAYGFVPRALAEIIRAKIVARYQAGILETVDRPKIEQRKAKRNQGR